LENRLNWFEEGQQITIVDGEITFSTVSSTIWHEIIGSCAVCNHDSYLADAVIENGVIVDIINIEKWAIQGAHNDD
jgi:hypothetical protein